MRILYHPRRILGFEPYVAPEGFDRKAQPVDIYDVFERYYRNHRTAKWIWMIGETNNETMLNYDSYGGIVCTYLSSYKLGGVRYSQEHAHTTLNQTVVAKTAYTTIDVTDASKLLNPAVTGRAYESIVISPGGSETYYGLRFDYTSIVGNTLHGTSTSYYTTNTYYAGNIIRQIIFFPTGSTGKYVIAKNTYVGKITAALSKIMGGEWAYCGIDVNAVSSYNAWGYALSLKYIHVHKLSDITSYPYLCHSGTSSLTGTLHVSPSVEWLAPHSHPGAGYFSSAFSGCTGLTGELYIPDNVKYIGRGTFSGCTGFTSIRMSPNVEYIGENAFSICTNLNGTLTIPDVCTEIEYNAFYNCNKLDTLDLGTGVITIGNSAFQACAQLTGTLTFPTSLTTIGTLAFYGCTGYTGTLTIASGITSIGQGAFGDDNFTDIDVTANSRYEDVDDVLYEISTRTALHSVKGDTGTITFQTNTLIIGDYCCLRNLRTGTLTVPDSVTRVGIYAFYDCNGFTAISLEASSSSLATIDDYAFSHCSSLAGTLTIPNSVTLIDAQAFQDDVLVSAIVFGSGLVTIGANAFRQMTAISENLVIPNSVETIGATAFYNNTARTGTLTLGTGLKTIGGQAFGNVPFTGTLAIPSLVTAIGEAAFWGNNFSAISSAATGFTVSDYVLYDETTSGQIKAHTSMRGYTGTMTLKAGTTSVLYLCFYNNDNRSGAIVIPYTVTLIRQQAFDDCSGFNSTATIGDTTNGSALSSIEAYAFRGCANITGWNIYRTPAPTCNSSFSNYAKPLHIKVGATGYDVTPATAAAPWTNTAIFSSVTADL